MKKFMKRVLLTLIITLLVVTLFIKTDGVKGADVLSIAVKNMVNIRVVDQFGNNINFGEITMKDKDGVDYAKMNLATGGLSTEAPRVMKMGQGFTIYATDVQKFVTSGIVVGVSAPDMKKGSHNYSNMLLENGSNPVRIWYVPDKTDYILDANTVGLVVDSKWENDASNPEIKINGNLIKINKNIGTTLYELEAGTYRPIYLLGGGSSGASLVSADAKTEYFKTKIKLSELDKRFDIENNIVIDANIKGQIAANKYYQSAVIFFISGGMITVPVPDSEGYVEIYVDKSTGIYEYKVQIHVPGQSYGINGSATYGYNRIDTNLQPQLAPNEGFSLMGVAEGKYTVNFEAGKSEYLDVKAKAIEVKNSDDIQTITITVHKHEYSVEFKTNSNEHWKECSCGDKKDIKAHTFDNSKYSFDEKIHWYQCTECNYKLNETEHNYEWVIDFEATEDNVGQKHEECTDCDYKKEAVEIPQIFVETEAPTERDTTIAPTEAETEKETEAETESETETEVQIKGDSKENNNWIWIVVGIGAFVVVTTVVLIILINKKKKIDE